MKSQKEETPEKPDFEAWVKKSAFKSHPLNLENDVITTDTAEYLLERIWNDYVASKAQTVWIKATERLPQHMIFQHIKVDGAKYTAYYDYSLKKFLTNVGHVGFNISDVEWLDEFVASKEVELSAVKEENKQLREIIKEEIVYAFTDFFDNPNGPYEYTCPFCSRMETRKGKEGHATMLDIKHTEDCAYIKAKALLEIPTRDYVQCKALG